MNVHCNRYVTEHGNLSSKINQLAKRVNRLARDIKKIKAQLVILPEIVNPLVWKDFDKLDHKILKILLKGIEKGQVNFHSSVEISKKVGVDRTKVWRHLKKIGRISKKQRGYPIVLFDSSLKKWTMNLDDYEYQLEPLEELT